MKINIRLNIYLINLLIIIKGFFCFSNYTIFMFKKFFNVFCFLKSKKFCAHNSFECVPVFGRFY